MAHLNNHLSLNHIFIILGAWCAFWKNKHELYIGFLKCFSHFTIISHIAHLFTLDRMCHFHEIAG